MALFKMLTTGPRLMTRSLGSSRPHLAEAPVSHSYLSLTSLSSCMHVCVCVCDGGGYALGHIRLNGNCWPARKVHWLALHTDNWPVALESTLRICAMLASWTNERCCCVRENSKFIVSFQEHIRLPAAKAARGSAKKETCLLTLVLARVLPSIVEISLNFCRTTVTLSSRSLPLSSSRLTLGSSQSNLTTGTQLPRKTETEIVIISNDAEIPIINHNYLLIWKTCALIKPFKNKDVELVELKRILIKSLNGNWFSDCLC